MSENKRFRVTIGNENDVRLVDYSDNRQLISIFFKDYKDAVDCRDALLYQCNMMNELSLWKIRYNELKEAHFTKMGGFSMERDGRGCYNILSENIIPKNSPVIQIKSPDAIWNSIVADIFSDLLTEEDGGLND